MDGMRPPLRRRRSPAPGERSAAGAFIPDAIRVGARHLQVGSRVGGLVRGHRLSPRSPSRVAAAAADLPRSAGRVAARRADRPGHRRGQVAAATGQAGIRPPAHRRPRPAARPAGRGRHRGRLRPGRPGRPRRGQAVPPRPVPHRPRHRHSRRLADEVAAVRALAASLLLDAKPTTYRSLQGWVTTPADGSGPDRDAPHLRHQRAGRGVPVHQPGPARAGPGQRRRPGRGALRAQPRLPGPGALGPVRPGQPQLGDPRPVRRGQVLPGQAGTAAQPVPGHRGRRHRPRRRIRPPRRGRRRHHVHLGAPGVRLNPFDLPIAHAPRRAAHRPTRRAAAPQPVPAHRPRRPARFRAHGHRTRRAGPRDHRHLPAGRDHRRCPHLDPARADPAGPARHADGRKRDR